MSKKRTINKAIIITSCALVIAIGLVFYKFTPNISYTNMIGIDLPKQSTVLKEEDSHGGFHGDGEYYSEIQLAEDSVNEFVDDVTNTGKWLLLPLSSDIANIISIQGHNPQNLNNGIYFVRDRFAEKYPDQKDTNINSRYSYNVTISIFDFDTNILYIYELDT